MDKEINTLIKKESARQQDGLNFIASENYPSQDVLKPLSSILTSKYAEGYPGARYYSGNQYIDQIEELACQRAQKLFRADHANVQPLSGNPANLAAYFALAKPGDKIMGMKLSHGGHLSHGHKVNFSAKLFDVVSYGVREDNQRLDYDQIADLAKKEKPRIIIAGASAYPREIAFQKFRDIANNVGAYLLVDMAHIAGLVAADLHMDPVQYAHVVTSTTHKTLRGPRGGLILCTKELADKVDRAVFPLLQGGPHEDSIAAKAVCFHEANSPEFKEYAKQVVANAKTLAKALIDEGFDLVSGGTDNHLVLVDLRKQKIDGVTAEKKLAKAGIYTNRNTIPFDPGSPQKPSGIRLGTAAMTTRGMQEGDMKVVAGLIKTILKADDKKAAPKVRDLADAFPLPG